MAVDLAHVWPQSVGGRLETLECKECNSRFGREYDVAVADHFRDWKAYSGTETKDEMFRLKFIYKGEEHILFARGRVREGGAFVCNYLPHKNNPKAVAAFKEVLAIPKDQNPPEIEYQTRTIDPRRFNTTLFHSAFLSLFWHFGYEYLFHAPTDWIRVALNSPTPPDWLTIPTDTFPSAASKLAIDPIRLFGICKGENSARCLLMPVPSVDSRKPFQSLLLPGFGKQAMDKFPALYSGGPSSVRLMPQTKRPECRLADAESASSGRNMYFA